MPYILLWRECKIIDFRNSVICGNDTDAERIDGALYQELANRLY